MRQLDVQRRTDDMTGCLFKGDILANKVETNLHFVMRSWQPRQRILQISWRVKTNAENKLICFSNPATNVHTAVFLLTPIWEWRRNLFIFFFLAGGRGGIRHVCMIFFLACMYCCLSVSDDDIFLRKFFNPHLPPFQVSNRPSLEFESVLLNDEFSIFSQWQWISAYSW